MELSEQLMLRPLYPQGNNPGTHWIGSWMGPRTGLEVMTKRKGRTSAGDRTPVIQPVAKKVYKLSSTNLRNLRVQIVQKWLKHVERMEENLVPIRGVIRA
jgi:hypothetical protein